jgi:acyl carrier protein
MIVDTMNKDELKTIILETLLQIAPETNTEQLQPGINFRDQLDFDSVDFLNFVLTLEKQLKIKIPEIIYPRLSNLDACVTYLQSVLKE